MANTPKQYPFYEEDEDKAGREPVDFQTVLDSLRAGETENAALSAPVYYGLSDIAPTELDMLRPIWDALDEDYRLRIVEELTETSETNYELDYHVIGHFALRDVDGAVRAAAVDLLWDDESLEFMHTLMHMSVHDDSPKARAAAVSALGRFIYSGELEELPLDETNQAQALAVSIYWNLDEHIDVRRRALEALSNSSNDNVTPAIRDGYKNADQRLKVSAVFAMGRSCDAQWNDIVLKLLTSSDAEMRYEAARAAGELEIEDSVPTLTELALGDDREIQEAAIWSLGEIGGNEALRALTKLTHEAEALKDEALIEAIEEAVANASLGSGALYMFNLDE